jgi:hypothetical protein
MYILSSSLVICYQIQCLLPRVLENERETETPGDLVSGHHGHERRLPARTVLDGRVKGVGAVASADFANLRNLDAVKG